MTNLLLVGGDHLFRQALAIVLAHAVPDCWVRAQTKTLGEALVLLLRERTIDGVIVDFPSWTEESVALVAELHQRYPQLPVLALTDPAVAHLVFPLRLAGAVQVIDKANALAVVVDGVRRFQALRSGGTEVAGPAPSLGVAAGGVA